MDIVTPTAEVTVPEKPLLRFHQREEMSAEIEQMESMMPQLKTPTDRGEVSKRLKRLKQSLETQSPQDLSGGAKDRLYQESKEIETALAQGMLTHEEMRKNPAGAVGYHMRWERMNKKKILRWKNIQQMLEPSSDDPDLSNFERLRPQGEANRFRTDAQITGHMSYGSIPQSNWDLAFQGKGPENSALQQAERVHAQEMGKPEKKRKRFFSPEQIEKMRQSMANARAKKKKAEAITEPTVEPQIEPEVS